MGQVRRTWAKPAYTGNSRPHLPGSTRDTPLENADNVLRQTPLEISKNLGRCVCVSAPLEAGTCPLHHKNSEHPSAWLRSPQIGRARSKVTAIAAKTSWLMSWNIDWHTFARRCPGLAKGGLVRVCGFRYGCWPTQRGASAKLPSPEE